MNIFIRVDVHMIIGIGHIYRCLKLLSYIEGNHNITFICKKYNNLNSENAEYIQNIYNKISKKYSLVFIDIDSDKNIIKSDMTTWLGEDYKLDAIKTNNKLYNCDILIIDHYTIDINWEMLVKKNVKKLIIIEDFVKRKHNCDILINGITNDYSSYKNLVNNDCKLLLGNEYLIIGNQFFNQDVKLREKNRISVFISGSDITDETSKIIHECNLINVRNNYKYTFDIIVGPLNKNYNKIKRFCEENKYFNIYYNIDNMAEILNKSYISIGALGQSLLEKIALNIPSLVLTISENQARSIVNLIQTDTFICIGNIPIDYSILLENNINKLYNMELYNKIKLNCIKYSENQKIRDII